MARRKTPTSFQWDMETKEKVEKMMQAENRSKQDMIAVAIAGYYAKVFKGGK